MKEILDSTLLLLSQVEVRGRRNLDCLLAAMQNLEQLRAALTPEKEARDDGHDE